MHAYIHIYTQYYTIFTKLSSVSHKRWRTHYTTSPGHIQCMAWGRLRCHVRWSHGRVKTTHALKSGCDVWILPPYLPHTMGREGWILTEYWVCVWSVWSLVSRPLVVNQLLLLITCMSKLVDDPLDAAPLAFFLVWFLLWLLLLILCPIPRLEVCVNVPPTNWTS